MQIEDVAKDIAKQIKESVEQGIGKVSEKLQPRLDALEEKIANIPAGQNGQDGTDGKTPSKEELQALIQEQLSELPAPVDGQDGQTVTVDDVRPVIEEEVQKAVAGIPAPKDGIDGKDAVIDMDAIKSMINDAVQKAVAEAVAAIEIPKPKDGEDGKDAIDIEILSEIDEEKSYARGTYALHNGGIFRSFERTKGMRGWECVVNGVQDISIEYDGQRAVTVKTIQANGQTVEKTLVMPNMIYKDIYREGEVYEKHDTVTLSGSLWIALEETKERPMVGEKSWQLIAKKGGTGKSAFDIAKDAGFAGTREDWLESLSGKTVYKTPFKTGAQ